MSPNIISLPTISWITKRTVRRKLREGRGADGKESERTRDLVGYVDDRGMTGSGTCTRVSELRIRANREARDNGYEERIYQSGGS